MNGKEKALILGDDTRSFLATVRSLGRKNIEVHVAPFDFKSLALHSRYIHAIHHLPYYLDGGSEWLSEIIALLRTERFSLLIPCDERSLLPLHLHRDALGEFCKLAIPSPEAMDKFFDKLSTRELATRCSVPIAPGKLLTTQDTADSIAAELGIPVVIKQPKSYAFPELYVRSSTKILSDKQQLNTWLELHWQKPAPILLEQMFPGFGLGVSVLCHEGTVLQAFEHHRANEVDGSSYYRKSAPINQERLAAVERMTKAIGFTGIAMFEFKMNPDNGSWILIEVNARPWGSLPLPVAIGIDFPYRLYRLLVHGEVTRPIAYPVNRYCRNLVLDFWQARKNTAILSGQPGKLLSYSAQWLLSFSRLLIGREHHDVLVVDDARPGLLEVRELTSSILKSVLRKFTTPESSLAALEQRIQALSTSDFIRVLFICQGNINRSSYAELKSRQLFSHGRYTFSSAGMLPRNRRPSPMIAIEAAARCHIDMSNHLSRTASLAELQAADLILAFDTINLRSIASRFPDLKQPVFLLGELNDDGKREIADPEGTNVETCLTTFQRINVCLEQLSEIADKHRPHH